MEEVERVVMLVLLLVDCCFWWWRRNEMIGNWGNEEMERRRLMDSRDMSR
jgi:hypothetical protein